MTSPLTPTPDPLGPGIPFGEALLPRVAAFDCGPEPWQREVVDWIRAPRGQGGALDAMADAKTAVWLYETTAGDLVGFGSLGLSEWRYPNPKKSPFAPLLVIPFFGIELRFQGFPPAPAPPRDRYAHRIFEDVLHRALGHPDQLPFLGLCVHPDNRRAIAFYERFGFVPFGAYRGLQRMLVRLRDPSPESAP